ncbi:hypothetical protein JCM9140_915 [Halalkalibacter wakoensis JCM 9140]|uniref:YqcI/YcgG family protein n=1 Tax=Halalkalibacter wakoensis JCM 9140 TaxID=1236970 RepID=W4Q0Q9_9BACI|nr:YqcI/YcgG family protein [Halalkalibacter wakoensis]GAE24949.1 hypothetical protein JCM9140_915 [Halalkalibacter wakoensis JCM 9140]
MILHHLNDLIEDINLADWQQDAIDQFKKNMSNKENLFPCIPATQSFFLNHLRYAFVGDPRIPKTKYELADILKEYAIHSNVFGKYSSLIVFFQTPEDLASANMETFEQLFWEQLTHLHTLDEQKWPDVIPFDPDHNSWEFCFQNERFFMYCATPSHLHRKSRYFPYFLFAITPRWVLEQFDETPYYATKIRTAIRERLIQYDDIPPHTELRMYGDTHNLEWKQYFLRDDQTTLNTCPFLKMIQNKKKNKR